MIIVFFYCECSYDLFLALRPPRQQSPLRPTIPGNVGGGPPSGGLRGCWEVVSLPGLVRDSLRYGGAARGIWPSALLALQNQRRRFLILQRPPVARAYLGGHGVAGSVGTRQRSLGFQPVGRRVRYRECQHGPLPT